MKSPPKITVLMPVYNGEKFLRDAIESILNQTFQDFEFLIIDDGSTDASVDIIKSYDDPRIRLITNGKNLNLINTLNKGIDLAHGKYIARMDCDDISFPKRLEIQYEFMESHPEVGICSTWANHIDAQGNVTFELRTPVGEELRLMFWKPSPIIHAACMGKTRIFKDNKYDTGYLHAEDYELWLRLFRKTKFYNINEMLYSIRIHESSVTRSKRQEQLRNSYLAFCEFLGTRFISYNGFLALIDENYSVHPKIRDIYFFLATMRTSKDYFSNHSKEYKKTWKLKQEDRFVMRVKNKFHHLKGKVKSKIKKVVYTAFDEVISASFAKKNLDKELLPRVKRYSKSTYKGKGLDRILQINTLGTKGGAAKIARTVNGELNKRGYSSKLLVDLFASPEESIVMLPRVNSLKQKFLWRAQENLGWLDFFHLSSFNIRDMESFKKCDIVHLHNLHGNYFSLFALPELTSLKPTLWTLHDMQAFTGHCAYSHECNKWETGCSGCPSLNVYPSISKDTASYLWDIKKQIFANSRLTIACPSKWLKDKVKNSYLGDHDVKVVYNGINTQAFQPTDKILARKKLGLPCDKKILIFSADGGAENFFKGGQYLYQVYERLKNRDDLLFLNIGGTKTEEKSLNWMNVSYVKDEETLALYYSAADLFIFPSLSETFGLVVAESFSCETPVVAFNNSAIPELVKHMENGYLAKHRDANDMLNGITTLLDNPELLEKAGKKARSLVVNNFTIDIMINNYIELYREVLDNFHNGRE